MILSSIVYCEKQYMSSISRNNQSIEKAAWNIVHGENYLKFKRRTVFIIFLNTT
ncbi:MAG: hypothetical protein ACI90V_004159 [Bacillariaceae sp.]|jgi:hypothetical protein